MCGRYTSVTPVAALARYFSVDEVVAEELPARYNVAPTQEVYAIARHGDTTRLGTLRWGLIPPWADDPRIGARMINARAESVADRPAFRHAFARRRCLLPADGFYEWRTVADGSLRQPWYIRHRNGQPMAIAGLWESWRPGSAGADGEQRIVSTTIVTTTANEAINDLHHRMPVVLAADAWDAWLDPTDHDVDALQRLLAPAPPADFDVTAVRPLVNNVANDGPELLQPVAPAPEPA
ncbi:MAG TPA: SOS response-associated peptidase [Acidimicrobiales bacterium]|nr:SOS response-associated peptidase [Acidimicrobiales bacterium]